MSKEELKQLVKELKPTVDNIKEEEDGEWRPRIGDKYYFLFAGGEYICYDKVWLGNDDDIDHLEDGNCFKTEEEALREKKIINVRYKLKKLSKKSMNGEVFHVGGTHWYIEMWTANTHTFSDVITHHNLISNPYPFSSKSDANNAIKEIGEENLKLYFGIDG